MAKRVFLIDLPHRSAPMAVLQASLRELEALPEDTSRKQEILERMRAMIVRREVKDRQEQAPE